ncbi:hypothetical protein [Bacillus cereus group sp. Bce004]|uniref:hypothetical protein n=1 Tax=Bacillus cereus group sp. Bce004 TaxID=3445257 RepID=UPI003F292FD7
MDLKHLFNRPLKTKVHAKVLEELGMSEQQLHKHLQQTGKRLSVFLEEQHQKRERS